MADPTITKEDGTVISLGKLQQISNELNANIIPLPMPTKGSDETETFDLLGVVRTLSLSGIFVGTTAEIVVLVGALDAIFNQLGGQQDSVTLYTDETGTVDVKLASMTTNWSVEGVSHRCEYRITCIQGNKASPL